MANTQPAAKKVKLTFVQKNCDKSTVKNFIEKPILLKFENCLRKHIFICNSTHYL